MKNAFNGNFYLTCATVIPVLYLTLAVQSAYITRTVKVLAGLPGNIDKLNLPKWVSRIFALEIRGRRPVNFLLALLVLALTSTAVSILINSVVAEASSFYALYYQKSNNPHRLLMVIVEFLVISTIVPSLTILISYMQGMTNLNDRAKRKMQLEDINRPHVTSGGS